MELFKALDNYNENEVIDNLCFEKMIWPEGLDPWNNVSNFFGTNSSARFSSQ